MTVSSSDKYTITFDSALTASTTITLSTSGTYKRAILFGIKVTTEATNIPIVSVTELEWEASETDTKTVTVTCSSDWTVTGAPEWATVTKADDGSSFTVTPTSANDGEERTATLTVTNSDYTDATATVTLSQKEAIDEAEYTSNVTWTLGTNAYSQTATVNGVSDVSVLKLGTSSAVGTATITLPSGTTTLSLYAVAWTGKVTTLTITGVTTDEISQTLVANTGATSNSPYTITVEDTDKYTFTFDALTVDTEITVATYSASSGYRRAILFGINAN